MKKIGKVIFVIFITSVIIMAFSSCGLKSNTLKVDTGKTNQTIEGFGASGAWWAQDVGGWTDTTESGQETRSEIMSLLYGKDSIGLSIYRYNLGAGSAVNPDDNLADSWRKTESFIGSDGTVDYSLDRNAVWCMQEAVNNGCDNVVFFSNSAPCNMTINGKAYCDKVTPDDENSESLPNLSSDKYDAFADYVINAADYFKSQGVPVTTISPINEPQWNWQGGQEGCHYTPEETVEIYKTFLEKMNNNGSDYSLSMFESGQCYDKPFTTYLDKIMNDDTLSQYFTRVSTHSYWANAGRVTQCRKFLNRKYKDLDVESSEWCQMTNGNGKDTSISSALVLANTVHNDLSILNSVSWSYWIAVSSYDYKDGLVYVNRDDHTFETTKRLYALGNYSKFIDNGMVRVDTNLADNISSYVNASAYYKDGKTVIVAINNSYNSPTLKLDFAKNDNFSSVKTYVTDCNYDLQNILDENFNDETEITLTQYSVTTIVLT